MNELINRDIMDKLVFLEPDRIEAVPFTTSKVIAEVSGIEHRKLKVAIRKHQTALESFGILAPYGAETRNGPGQPEILYRLNEQQATLLMTFLKNTPVVVRFKTELVRQFYAMRSELQRRELWRSELKPIRRDLTDAIRDLPEHPHKGWDYKQYTDLAYKHVTGKNAAQLRKGRGAAKTAKAIDYLNSAELEAVTKAQSQIAVLLDMGMGYEQVKTTLANARVRTLAG